MLAFKLFVGVLVFSVVVFFSSSVILGIILPHVVVALFTVSLPSIVVAPCHVFFLFFYIIIFLKYFYCYAHAHKQNTHDVPR